MITDRRFHDLPIVALTASTMKGDDTKAFDAGCDGHISKPIDTRRLPVLVEDFLRGRRRTDEAP